MRTHFFVQMLHKWIGKSLEQHSSFLAVILVLLLKNKVHVLLKSIHASVERLVLIQVVTHIKLGLEEWEKKRFFAMVMSMEGGQATKGVSGECNFVCGLHKGCISPD